MLYRISGIISILLLPLMAFNQNCDLILSGHITDINTGFPISNANIIVHENQKGTVSDTKGYFQLKAICKGEYHISISHITCKSQRHKIQITQDTTIPFFLNHYNQELNTVVINGNLKQSTQRTQSINELNITKNTSQTLSNMIESLTGVSVIKNGSGISKPMVHGLYGNRLTILNNGIAQSGQQWGQDHSPEIDPLVASKISVISGARALEYQGNSLGSVILVEPKSVNKDKRLHSKTTYFFESNGRANSLNVQLQKHSDKLAWKIIGTIKKSGDKRTDSYYLRNTGSRETNIAILLEKIFFKKWHTNLYFSSFNTKLGILRGSHIGNLSDLQEALTREVPFYTEKKFSYALKAPKQKVNHQLLKLQTKYFIDDQQGINISYAAQINNRKEFDIRRSKRSSRPAMSLYQISHFLEGKYQNNTLSGLNLKAGLQLKTLDNRNDPVTGILPLIPDYQSYTAGLFVTATQKYTNIDIELGARFDKTRQDVAAISLSVPRKIINYNNHFQNYSAAAGISYKLTNSFKLAYNVVFATRQPGINELYSNGLHQGVGGIEEGDPLLKSEKALKSSFSINSQIKENLFFESLIYYQNIKDYIFLSPQNEMRLSIRGAFPVFRYEQTDANIYGLDLALTYHASNRFTSQAKYSHIRGNNKSQDLPLINMPSDKASVSLKYKIGKIKRWEKLEVELRCKQVFKQTNLLTSQDFVISPPSYNLLGLKLFAQRQFKASRLSIFFKIDNLLNVKYRDYLNRQRYFANDLGINLSLGFSLSL